MSIIATSGFSHEPKKYDLFDQSVFFGSALKESLKDMKVKAINEVPNAAKTWEELDSTRRIARKLIEKLYQEFAQTLRKDYSTPEFSAILETSIKHYEVFFTNDLFELVKAALDDLYQK
ncbi:MAG TPA: hypothetical protein VLE96_00735 [Chlamydiales bacterium]|nr:hypothetical protein [Chlamydiales bacterium]